MDNQEITVASTFLVNIKKVILKVFIQFQFVEHD